MPELARGLYEVLITKALEAELENIGHQLRPDRGELRSAEAADRIALHIGRLVQRAIEGVDEDERVGVGVTLARRLLAEIDLHITDADVSEDAPIEPGAVLRALLAHLGN